MVDEGKSETDGFWYCFGSDETDWSTSLQLPIICWRNNQSKLVIDPNHWHLPLIWTKICIIRIWNHFHHETINTFGYEEKMLNLLNVCTFFKVFRVSIWPLIAESRMLLIAKLQSKMVNGITHKSWTYSLKQYSLIKCVCFIKAIAMSNFGQNCDALFS